VAISIDIFRGFPQCVQTNAFKYARTVALQFRASRDVPISFDVKYATYSVETASVNYLKSISNCHVEFDKSLTKVSGEGRCDTVSTEGVRFARNRTAKIIYIGLRRGLFKKQTCAFYC
jgi:hypothetical protein